MNAKRRPDGQHAGLPPEAREYESLKQFDRQVMQALKDPAVKQRFLTDPIGVFLGLGLPIPAELRVKLQTKRAAAQAAGSGPVFAAANAQIKITPCKG